MWLISAFRRFTTKHITVEFCACRWMQNWTNWFIVRKRVRSDLSNCQTLRTKAVYTTNEVIPLTTQACRWYLSLIANRHPVCSSRWTSLECWRPIAGVSTPCILGPSSSNERATWSKQTADPRYLPHPLSGCFRKPTYFLSRTSLLWILLLLVLFPTPIFLELVNTGNMQFWEKPFKSLCAFESCKPGERVFE